MASAKSNVNGYFYHRQHRFLQPSTAWKSIPWGSPKVSAPIYPKVALPGIATGPLTIDWGAASGTSFGGNNFISSTRRRSPLDNTLSEHLLIITSQAIANQPHLSYYLNFKRAQGFTVEVAAVENIQATSPGANLVEKIRNFEISRRAAVGSSFKYVLLIGANDTIPFGSFNGGARRCGLLPRPRRPTAGQPIGSTST